MKCSICDSPNPSFFDKAVVLGKYEIFYFECNHCGLVNTGEPYWLEEAYSDAIGQSDIGLVSRNLINADLNRTDTALFFDRYGTFLDYGGGYGLFVRMMRDQGLDFYLYEPNSKNLYAKSFEINLPPDAEFHLVTAFEVLEHLRDPLAEIEQMLKLSPSIFFSTTLLPTPSPKPSQWWYYSLEGGQHISLYTRRSLQCLADRLGVRVYSDGRSHHLFTNMKISPLIYAMAVRVRISRLINQFIHQSSLLSSDYLRVVGRPLE